MSTKKKLKVGKLVNAIQADTQTLIAGQVGAAKAIQDIADAASKRGRPAGAKNREVDVVDAEVTRCACGSTNRAQYFNRRELDVEGVHILTRKPYTKIVIRRTRCLDCGQHRDDREFLNQPKKASRRRA